MQFNVVFLATAVVASASVAMSTTVTGWAGADCTGSSHTYTVKAPECLSLGSGSVKSFSYAGVPHEIKFYLSGGGHDSCTNGAYLVLGSGSGCGTAPAGYNWESVEVL
ncbi:hypothetical protein MSAN_01947000 [Mycena sanguinolenta]|uniref:Uncharacterized protein n=1 Tax=Mycena sanguinolenta TaxID=230812 RepID=A0A8H6XNJ8_9AGAR|nr:hypothetical protein MSAN_01947000 [Mycena sanguinolenta]